jgi:hypothetical protein
VTNSKARPTSKVIKVLITAKMIAQAMDSGKFNSHRELVEAVFKEKHYAVTSHAALMYFELRDGGNRPAGFIIEGIPGISVASI